MDDISVLEPAVTTDEAFEALPTAEPIAADFSQHRDCGHWRS